MNQFTTQYRGRGSLLCMVATLILFQSPALAEEKPQRLGGIVWSTDMGFRAALAGDIRMRLEEGWIAGMGVGVQNANLEASLIGRLSVESQTVGIEGLIRMPFFKRLFLGGGVHLGLFDRDQALEIVLPRADLRFRLSQSWVLSWTVLRLSLAHKLQADSLGPYEDEKWSLMAATSLGVRGRVNGLWERDPPAPLSPGVLIRVNHMIGMTGLVADERYNQSLNQDWEDARDDFPHQTFPAIELTGGYRFSFDTFHLELGIPVGIYNEISAGLGAMFRFKALPFLAIGLQASYYPDRYILVELPRVTLTYRPSDAVEIFLNPIGLFILIEPTRDVWVEEGFESKVPYWGLLFGTGIGWTVPTGG